MAGQEGIEPPTCGFGDRRSAYWATGLILLILTNLRLLFDFVVELSFPMLMYCVYTPLLKNNRLEIKQNTRFYASVINLL